MSIKKKEENPWSVVTESLLLLLLQMKDNPTLSNFFQGMSYSSFQKMADAYLEKERSPTRSPPTVLPTAPELVKLAFTLDFTARIVGLSRQNIGHITGLGNRYLQDRFEYQQVRSRCGDSMSPALWTYTSDVKYICSSLIAHTTHTGARFKTLRVSFAGVYRPSMVRMR